MKNYPFLEYLTSLAWQLKEFNSHFVISGWQSEILAFLQIFAL
jgi:hypothetical protein